jgi:Fic family protein
MSFIYEVAQWPHFKWNEAKLSPLLANVRHRQGRLLDRMEGLGFPIRVEASLTTLTADVVKSSAIKESG